MSGGGGTGSEGEGSSSVQTHEGNCGRLTGAPSGDPKTQGNMSLHYH